MLKKVQNFGVSGLIYEVNFGTLGFWGLRLDKSIGHPKGILELWGSGLLGLKHSELKDELWDSGVPTVLLFIKPI